MKKRNAKSGIFLALAILVLVAIGAWFFWDRSPSPAGPAGPSKGAVQEDEADTTTYQIMKELQTCSEDDRQIALRTLRELLSALKEKEHSD